MTSKPVILKLHHNGQRKIVFRIQMEYINFPPKKSGGIARYVEHIGGLLSVVEQSGEQVVQFVQEKTDIYFLTRKDCSLKRLPSFFMNELYEIF